MNAAWVIVPMKDADSPLRNCLSRRCLKHDPYEDSTARLKTICATGLSLARCKRCFLMSASMTDANAGPLEMTRFKRNTKLNPTLPWDAWEPTPRPSTHPPPGSVLRPLGDGRAVVVDLVWVFWTRPRTNGRPSCPFERPKPRAL